MDALAAKGERVDRLGDGMVNNGEYNAVNRAAHAMVSAVAPSTVVFTTAPAWMSVRTAASFPLWLDRCSGGSPASE